MIDNFSLRDDQYLAVCVMITSFAKTVSQPAARMAIACARLYE